MDEIVYQLSLLLNFILTFFIFLLVCLLLFELSFRLKPIKKIAKGKLKLYGLFMGLKNYDIFLLSLKTISYIFLLWAIFSQHIEKIHFLLFLFIQILFDLCSKRIVTGIFNLFNSVFLCFLLYSKLIFYEYLVEISFLWYVVAILILLDLFIFFYSTYFYLKDIEFLLKRNEYVKKMDKVSRVQRIKEKVSSVTLNKHKQLPKNG